MKEGLTEAPLVSVVVPTRNRASLLPGLLTTLDEQDYPEYEVIVVDDASEDETEDVLESWRDDKRRIALRINSPSGSYAARNWGWREASGAIIAFTDDDCLPEPGWLTHLVAGFNRPEVVGVQGMTLAPAARMTPFTHQIEQTEGGPPYRTCNISYRSSTFERLGGFDDSLRWYADNIFGLRARCLGPISFAPEAVVLHPPRPREWRDRAAWRARFAADAVHRKELRRLSAEHVTVPGQALPIVLWVLRPLAKQSLTHLRYLLRHPAGYVREVQPMIREKRELLAALKEYWRDRRFEPETRERISTLDVYPLISVVVVTRDRPEMLRETLAALQAQTYSKCAIVVADNGTDPRTRKIAREAGAQYISAEGLALGAARQAGVDAAPGQIVAFTDDDCLPQPEWLERIVDTFRRHPELHGLQGRTEAAPGAVGSHAIRITQPDPLFQTCNMAYRSGAIQRAGGFDPRFRGWFEDTAMAARVLQHGPIGFEPEALVTHRSTERKSMDRAAWRAVLQDERLLAQEYSAFYRRTRGPGFLLTVIARWLIGSPLKTLGRELPGLRRDPEAYFALVRLLSRERWELVGALRDVMR
jgi:glycosyltransferase involved in cell wall biosynthesis